MVAQRGTLSYEVRLTVSTLRVPLPYGLGGAALDSVFVEEPYV